MLYQRLMYRLQILGRQCLDLSTCRNDLFDEALRAPRSEWRHGLRYAGVDMTKR